MATLIVIRDGSRTIVMDGSHPTAKDWVSRFNQEASKILDLGVDPSAELVEVVQPLFNPAEPNQIVQEILNTRCWGVQETTIFNRPLDQRHEVCLVCGKEIKQGAMIRHLVNDCPGRTVIG